LLVDREFVLWAVQRNGRNLHYASLELQGDNEIVLAAVKHDGWSVLYAATKLKANQEFFKEVSKHCSHHQLSEWNKGQARA